MRSPLRKVLAGATAVLAASGLAVGLSSSASATDGVVGKAYCTSSGTDFVTRIYNADRRLWSNYLAYPGDCYPLIWGEENLQVWGITFAGNSFFMGNYPSYQPRASILTSGKRSNQTWTWRTI